MPEVTKGDAELSRRAHAERALEALEKLAETIRFRVGLYDPDEREPLREFAAAIAINALRAGYFARAADSKGFETDAVRGQKTKSSAKTGGEIRATQTKPTTDAVLAEMRLLIDAGVNISRAALAVHKKGIGSSKEANRHLWNLHNPKKYWYSAGHSTNSNVPCRNPRQPVEYRQWQKPTFPTRSLAPATAFTAPPSGAG
jgi:hypothetical protein